MIDFLFKSSISLLTLLLFYHLILEKEKMYQFNRFYLLFSLVFSFAIPFITIEIIGETIAPVQQTYTYVTQGNLKMTEIKETIDYKPIILWSLYGLVALILLFRYVRNILKIVSNINSNPIVEYKNAKLVLLEEQIPPHTFLNYIFLNRTEYQNRKIEEELYAHELIHVNQKHTLDVLLVESLKTVFWFNPLFIFYKRAIQLNHEFLADEKVVNAYNDIPFYQNLLLAHANTNPTFALTSNLNYSITKKRFIMMTKTVSKTKVFLYKIALLPLLSGLIFLTCVESVAQIETTTNPKKKDEKIVYSTVIPTPNWTESAVKKESPSTKESKIIMNSPSIVSVPVASVPVTSIPAVSFKSTTPTEKIIAQPIETKTAEIQENKIYSIAEVTEKPEFPGGIEQFYRFVGVNFKTPTQPNLKGKVYITFVIEKDGSLSNLKNIRDIGYGTGDEAIRVLKLSPKWIPGKIDGNPVRVLYSLPISIQSSK